MLFILAMMFWIALSFVLGVVVGKLIKLTQDAPRF